MDKVTGCENTVRVDLSTKSINDKQIGPLHERIRVSTVYTPLSCSATGSDHLSLCVYRHLLMPTVRGAWRPQRLFHGHFTPCPLPLPPFSSPPCNAATNWPAKGRQPITPAMAAGITDHVWTMEELLSYRVPPDFRDQLDQQATNGTS